MTLARSALLGLTAALAAGGLIFTSATGAPAHEPPSKGAASQEMSGDTDEVEASVVYKHVWRNAPSHSARSYSSPTGGQLYGGNNYFYCQNQGRNFSDDGYSNHWWLLTDDDSGNSSVWVSAVYISGGNDNERIDGVRDCRPAEVAAAGDAP